MAEDIFTDFLAANSETETPMIYYRWCMMASVGALLARSAYIKHGQSNLFPNLYTMLIGSAGTRKSTPIKLCKSLLREAGYETIAADKTSKEKFLVDLEGHSEECFIMADEANDFFGHGNIEFLSLLGNLWDYSGDFKYRIKTGKSICIHNPTISILSANTPTGFAMGFPSEILGQGFFSRLLLIHGEDRGVKIAFPVGLENDVRAHFIQKFQRIKSFPLGELEISGTARKLLEKIYTSYSPIQDPRFASYSNRRFVQLLKICMIYAGANESRTISETHVINANTVLTHVERYMPKALGEFGKAKNSDVAHKVVEVIERIGVGAPFKSIWKAVQTDLEKPNDLATMLQALQVADKIQSVNGLFLPRKALIETNNSDMLNWDILHPEERDMTI
jgi:hypothetical protein